MLKKQMKTIEFIERSCEIIKKAEKNKLLYSYLTNHLRILEFYWKRALNAYDT